MRDPIYFELEMMPVVRHRARFGKGQTYSDPASILFEQAFRKNAEMYRTYPPMDGPVKVEIEFWKPFPKHRKDADAYPKRGDVDNFAKAVLDSLQNKYERTYMRRKVLIQPGFIEDDQQVVHLDVKKGYSHVHSNGLIRVKISPLQPYIKQEHHSK